MNWEFYSTLYGIVKAKSFTFEVAAYNRNLKIRKKTPTLYKREGKIKIAAVNQNENLKS